MSKLTVSYDDGFTQVFESKLGLVHDFKLPDDGIYYQALHDFENEISWGSKPRSIVLNYKKDPPSNALPETVPLRWNSAWGTRTDFFPLNKAWQEWICYDLIGHAHPNLSRDELKKVWFALTGPSVAFTDRHSRAEGFKDWVNDINPNGKDMEWKNITTGGNVFKLVDDLGASILFETLDVSKSPPPIDSVWDKSWLVHWATEETTLLLPDGRWRVSPFPQANSTGIPIPLLSIGGVGRIEKHRIKKIASGGVFSPYVPEGYFIWLK